MTFKTRRVFSRSVSISSKYWITRITQAFRLRLIDHCLIRNGNAIGKFQEKVLNQICHHMRLCEEEEEAVSIWCEQVKHLAFLHWIKTDTCSYLSNT